MNIFILTEGSKTIGFGHITRCTSIYQAFAEKGITPLFIVNGDETVEDLLKAKNVKLLNWLHYDSLFSIIEDADILVIDSYLASLPFYEKISESVKLAAYVDDFKRIDYPKGIVLNGAIGADKIDYPVNNDVRYLLGPKYALLRKEFWDIPDKEIKETINTIMLTVGGEDLQNLTPLVLKFLISNHPDLIKKVVIGKGFENIYKLEEIKDSKTELIYFPDAEKMKNIMMESDIAISAGGQTLYELAVTGTPTIAMKIAQNQTTNIKGLTDASFILYAGDYEDKDILEKINLNIKLLKNKNLRTKIYNTGKKLVNGHGSRLIAEILLKNVS